MSEAEELIERLQRIAERGEGREVMNAEEAADFLRISHEHFRKIAPKLPRKRVTERRHVYLRSELMRWLQKRGN